MASSSLASFVISPPGGCVRAARQEVDELPKMGSIYKILPIKGNVKPIFINNPRFGECATKTRLGVVYFLQRGGERMNRIKELRMTRGMTQKDLAKLLNCAPTAVSKYELEQLGIDSEKINVLCDVFEVTADYLLCRSSSPAPVIAEEDAAVLDAYHAAPQEIRAIVDTALAPYHQSAIGSSTA